jgi:proteasome lid subunit RPN8/RPN11
MSDKPISSDGGSAVEFDSAVLQQIRRHARGSMEAEICGVLIGGVTDGVTRVEACIAGEKATEGGAHVTFTQQTWEHIYKVKDAKFADSSIVGWYHSHPGFGIFLSDYDLFIHKNFFAAPHQVAWVFDPHSDEEGCFGWASGEIIPLKRFSVLHDGSGEANKARPAAHDPRTIDPTAFERSGTGDWKRHLWALRKWIMYALAVVLVCVSGLVLYRRFAHPKSLTEAQTSQAAAHKRQSRQTLAEWERRKKDTIQRNSQGYDSRGSHFISFSIEVGPIDATTIDHTNNPGKNGDNILRIECPVTFYWSSFDQLHGQTEIRYTYDNRKHHADAKNFASNASSEVDKRELSEITEDLANLLFKEN